MLSDEEKKAIEDLKEISHYCSLKALDIEDKYSDLWTRYIISIQKVFNLIEKQSKEIEELNRENTRQHELIGNIHQKWKDKIKAKIEELKKNKDFDEDVYVEEYAVDVLQSLLNEKE